MDATQRVMCQKDLFNPLSTMLVHMSGILVISHLFLIALKQFGLAGPIAPMLAGLVVGPSGLSNIKLVASFLIQSSTADYYQAFSLFARTFFMFLIGLEMDIPYLRRNFRRASYIAFGGIIMCSIFAIAIALIILHELGGSDSKFTFVVVMMFILANTASPVVIRLAAELKFATSNIGRLAISSSLINEMFCVFGFAIYSVFKSKFGTFKDGLISLILTVGVIFANKYLAIWFNRRNRNQKYLYHTEVFSIMCLVIGTAVIVEIMNYDSMIACFSLGMMFPREGKTARTLLHKLTFATHTFILPIYFGYTGFQFNVRYLNNFENIMIVVLMILLSFSGKISGTLAACHCLKIPLREGVVLAFLLNLKGNAELLLLVYASKSISWWSGRIHNLVLIQIVLNTLIAGPIVAFLLRRDEILFAHTQTTLESHQAENELRILACVYGPRQVNVTVGLFSAISGCEKTSITTYMMHLVELVKKRKANLTYHEREEGDHDYSDDEYYGGNDVLEINDAVDGFTAETGLLIHQLRNVSSLASMYEDVCNAAEDLRVSIILLPFHKHQRLDGKMEITKVGIRTTNQKILRHAPCSVGIIIDRGLAGLQQRLGPETSNHIAVLFISGPDDREALACSRRIIIHNRLNLTVIRFLPTPSKDSNQAINNTSHRDNEILMAISSQETEKERDNAMLEEFYDRYVKTGQVGYVEKYVNNGEETVMALRDIADMYSLFIVGKAGRGHSPLTTGLSDWEECPELGTVGDLMASSDFNISASILVIQQHRQAKSHLTYD